MLDLLETISGAVVLAFYLGVAVVLPSGVVFLFVSLIGTLLRLGLDPIVAAIPALIRTNALLVPVGQLLRGIVLRAIGLILFLALVGTSTQGLSSEVVQDGFAQLLITFTAIQDIVATFMTGRVLNDMLLQLAPAPGESQLVSLKLFDILVANYLYATLKPGVTSLAFRWTFAAFATGTVAVYIVFEPLRAVRHRVAQLISPASREVTLSEGSLERQAELIAQALAKVTPAAATAPAPAPALQWARPGTARTPSAPLVPVSPAAVPSQRVAIVTWDEALAVDMERQLDAAGFSPLVLRSVAEAFSSRVWPQMVFLDARHLQWLSPDRLPLLVRARLVAVTSAGARVPRGWQLDTHAVESGTDALLELLRRRDARRRASPREGGA